MVAPIKTIIDRTITPINQGFSGLELGMSSTAGAAEIYAKVVINSSIRYTSKPNRHTNLTAYDRSPFNTGLFALHFGLKDPHDQKWLLKTCDPFIKWSLKTGLTEFSPIFTNIEDRLSAHISN